MHSQLWLKNTRHHILLMVVIALSVFVAATGCDKQGDTGEQIVRIASVLPLTGAASSMGQDMRQGQELAAEYFNTLPERKRDLQVTFEDSKSSPAEGTKAVQSLLAQGHNAFVVVLSTVCMAVKPILVENGAFAFLDVSHPGVTNPPNPLIFRHSQTAEAEAEKIVPAAIAAPGTQLLVVFYLNDDYGQAFVKTIHSLAAGQVQIADHAYESTTTDFRTLVQAADIPNTKGATVVTIGVGKPLGLVIKAVREQGYNGPIYASLGYSVTGSRDVLGSDRAGINYTDLTWRDTEAARWAIEKYRAKYQKEPSISTVIEFQTVLLMAKCLDSTSDLSPQAAAKEVGGFASEIIGVAPTQTNDINPVVLLKEDGVDAL